MLFMELTENNRDQLIKGIADGLRDAADRLERGEVLAPRIEFMWSILRPKDTSSITAMVHGGVDSKDYLISIDLPADAIRDPKAPSDG